MAPAAHQRVAAVPLVEMAIIPCFMARPIDSPNSECISMILNSNSNSDAPRPMVPQSKGRKRRSPYTVVWFLVAYTLSPFAQTAVDGFTEKQIAFPKGAEDEALVCDVWTPPASGPGSIHPPVLFSRSYVDSNGFVRIGFCVWELGQRLRQSSTPLPSSNIVIPDPAQFQGALGRYAVGTLAADQGPSLFLATGEGIVAYPSTLSTSGRRPGVLDATAVLRLVQAPFPDTISERPNADMAPATFAVDMDGDGKDEFIVPTEETGQWTVFGGSTPETYDQKINLPASHPRYRFDFSIRNPERPYSLEASETRSVTPAHYAVADMHLLDLNKDHRLDVVTMRLESDRAEPHDRRVDVFHQQNNGGFRNTPDQTIRYQARSTRNEWRDINGDGWIDLIEISEYFDIVDPLMTIEYYQADGPVSDWRDKPATRSFRTPNPFGFVMLGDWDHDGDTDLAHTYVSADFANPQEMISKIIGKSLELEIWFYEFTDNGFRPAMQKTVRIRNECLDYRFPSETIMRMTDDLTGDGKPDLLIRTAPDKLALYETEFPQRIGSRPTVIFEPPSEGFPSNEERLFSFQPLRINHPHVNDLDGDGRADVWWVDSKTNRIRCFLQNAPNEKKGWWASFWD